MIAWFGPALLLMLFAASQLPERVGQVPASAAAVLAEDFGVAVWVQVAAPEPSGSPRVALFSEPLPRVKARSRAVLGGTLPAARAPTS